MDQRLPGHQGRRNQGVVGRIRPGLGHGGRELIRRNLERLRVRQGGAQRVREGLGVRWRRTAQSRFTAAAAASMRIIPP